MMELKLSETNAPTKILLIAAERLGDTLFITPAVNLLKRSLPNVRFDVLAFSALAADIFQDNPHVDRVHISNNALKTRRIIQQYELAVNLMHEMLKNIGKLPANLVSIGLPDTTKHRVIQAIEYVHSILASPVDSVSLTYDLFTRDSHRQTVQRYLAQQKVYSDKHILIGCQLGCHRVARRGWKIWNRSRHQHKKVWPLENYIDLAQRLMDTNPNVRFVLTGSPNERYLAKMFLDKCPQAVSLIGKTTLHELTALMDELRVLVTHDTGTMHIACTRKTPLITLFGPTPVEFTGPFPRQPYYTIINKPVINDITVAEVYEAILPHL